MKTVFILIIVNIIIFIFGIETLKITEAGYWLPYASGFTIIVASIIALNSNNLKLEDRILLLKYLIIPLVTY